MYLVGTLNRGVTDYLKLGGRRRCPPEPSILPKTEWAIAHPAHPAPATYTPVERQ
jgi:hypothetical protein